MKKILPLLLLFSLGFNGMGLLAQAPNWFWEKSVGNNGADFCHGTCVDRNGNVFLTGSFSSSFIVLGNDTLSNSGSGDIFIIKLDSDGNIIWTNSAGGSNMEAGYSCTADSLGNVYITGYFQSPSINFSGIILTSDTGSHDIFIAKYDSLGNIVWAKKCTNNSFAWSKSITNDSLGNVFITGYFIGSIMFDSTSFQNANSNSTGDIFIAKYDSNSNLIWVNIASGTGNDNSNSVSCDRYGYIYITGFFTSYPIYFDNITLFNNGNEDIFLAKLDQNGNFIWAKKEGSYGADSGNDIVIDFWGNIYLTGIYFSYAINFGGTVVNNVSYTGYFDFFLVKYDFTGNVLWAKSYGGYYSDYGISLSTDLSGNTFITGYYQSDAIEFGNNILNNLNPNSYSDIFIAKHDTNGNILWAKTAGGWGDDGASGVASYKNDYIYISGNFASNPIYFDNDSLINNGSGDFFIAKLCSGNSSNTTNNISICNGENIIVGSNVYSVSGTYNDVFTAANGCDSIINTNLIVLPKDTFAQNVPICNGQSINVGSNTYSVNGNYIDTLTSYLSCDSLVYTTLFVVSEFHDSATFSICNGDSIYLQGYYQTTTGIYYDTLVAMGGCDSIVETILTVNQSATSNVQLAICSGDSVFLSGSWQLAVGSFYDTLQAVNGCDSIVETTLTINQTFLISESVAMCNGDSVLLSGSWQFAGGSYYDTLQTVNGCDSIVETTLTINPTFLISESVAICNGDSILVGGNYQTTAGTYYDSLQAINGCDSIIAISLEVNENPNISLTSTPDWGNANGTATVVASGGTSPYSYLWSTLSGFQTLTGLSSGIYSVTVTDANGCDMVDSVFVDFYSSVSELRIKNSELIIIPNPNKGEFVVQITEKNRFTEYEMKIYNMLGEVVYQKSKVTSQKMEIDLGKRGSGVYYVQVIGESGVMTKKVVVE